MLRQILAETQSSAIIQAVLCAGEQSDYASTELPTAAAISSLQEIAHFYQSNGLHPGIPGVFSGHESSPPWHSIYLVHGGPLGKQASWQSAVEQMTDFLCVDACTALGEVLDQARSETLEVAQQQTDHEWNPWLRMYASRRLDLSTELDANKLALRLTLRSLQEWLAALARSGERCETTRGQVPVRTPTR